MQDTTSDIAYGHTTKARRHFEVAGYIADVHILTSSGIDRTGNVIEDQRAKTRHSVDMGTFYVLDIDLFAGLSTQNSTSDIAYGHTTKARRHFEVAGYIADVHILTSSGIDETGNVIEDQRAKTRRSVDMGILYVLDIDFFAGVGAQNATGDIAYGQATKLRRHVKIAIYIIDSYVLTSIGMN